MRELPSPTLPLLGILPSERSALAPSTQRISVRARERIASLLRPTAATTHSAPVPLPVTLPEPTAPAARPVLKVVWATHQDEVRAAQRLRYQVFGEEMGARLPRLADTPPGHDEDALDQYCEHLLVYTSATDDAPARVIGTYRVLTPGAARRAGRSYAEQEFDLSPIRHLQNRMAELGRSCVHPEHRNGGAILTLWSGLAQFMAARGLTTMLGCASIGIKDGGHTAASVWRQLSQSHGVDAALRVTPRLPLPLETLNQQIAAEPPALIKGYVRCGAKVLGAPAWDPDFNCADLPLLLQIDDLTPRYRRHFLVQH